MKTNVKIPRWFYRDVHVAASHIRENAMTLGIREAMLKYILQRKDRLPEGMTADAAVDQMLTAVDGFAVAHSEGKTQDDIKRAIQAAIADMEQSQALAYLASLEVTFCACDVSAANKWLPDVESIQEQIRDAVDGAAAGAVEDRIAKLAEMLQGNSLAAYVYAAGNDEVKDLVKGANVAAVVSVGVATQIHYAMLSAAGKAEIYAANVCAVYGMILDGKIAGISPDLLDVRVMTALVVAGMEKASIFTRLARGEIDRELALELLSVLSRTLKWILVTILQVLAAGTFFMFFHMMSSSVIFLSLGLVAAVCIAIALQDEFEEVLDFIEVATAAAITFVCSAIAWVWQKGKALVTPTKSVVETTTPKVMHTPNAMPAC